eukprot:scaffold103128_cov31-Tisochrysis_lutea.AAC.3
MLEAEEALERETALIDEEVLDGVYSLVLSVDESEARRSFGECVVPDFPAKYLETGRFEAWKHCSGEAHSPNLVRIRSAAGRHR